MKAQTWSFRSTGIYTIYPLCDIKKTYIKRIIELNYSLCSPFFFFCPSILNFENGLLHMKGFILSSNETIVSTENGIHSFVTFSYFVFVSHIHSFSLAYIWWRSHASMYYWACHKNRYAFRRQSNLSFNIALIVIILQLILELRNSTEKWTKVKRKRGGKKIRSSDLMHTRKLIFRISFKCLKAILIYCSNESQFFYPKPRNEKTCSTQTCSKPKWMREKNKMHSHAFGGRAGRPIHKIDKYNNEWNIK